MATSPISAGSIDVATLVSQLMAVERQPLNRLQSRENQVQSKLSAFGRIQSALSTLESSVQKLSLASSFSAAKAGATGTAATATASGSAATGTYEVAVEQLARAQSSASAAVAASSTPIGSGTLTLRDAGGAVLTSVNIGAGGSGTLAEARDLINAANTGVRASLVGDGGQVRLVLNSTQTGAANAFTIETDPGLTGLSFPATPVQEARDARFSVNGLALTSASNTISDAIEGVTLTLTGAPPAGSAPGTTLSSQVTVATDADASVAAVKAFVTAYNDLESLVTSLSKFDPNTKTAAVLNGESALRSIQTQLRGVMRGVVSGGAGEYGRLVEVGISVQTNGSLTLDESKLRNAVTADPARVGRLFSNASATESERGIAVRMDAAISTMLDANGLLDSRQSGLRSQIRNLDQQQERMEARLALIEQRLTRQYSALDALLSTRSSQSNALANALAGLPSAQQG